jgi:ATP-dependent Clp protease, protease subunit
MDTNDKHHGQHVSPIFHTRLIGHIDEKSIEPVCRDIDRANSDDRIEKIILTISSNGGWLQDAFALYDAIKLSKKPVDTVAQGYCKSAGVMILQAGRKRFSTPHTNFMLHPSNNMVDKTSHEEFLMLVEEYKQKHKLFVELSINRSKITHAEFEKNYKPRKDLTPTEALKYGFIDEILTY